ncbi:MAG: hypothetical protein AB7V46_05800 [Thermomicrobiales bacterium]
MRTRNVTIRRPCWILASAIAIVMAASGPASFMASDASARAPGLLLGESGNPAESLANANSRCASLLSSTRIGPGYLVDDAEADSSALIERYSRAELGEMTDNGRSCDASLKSHPFGMGFLID